MAAALFTSQANVLMRARALPTREGFTLIELLIVIVIIGILAMIATSLFWSVKDRSIQTSMQSDLRSAATQQEIYFASNNQYAPTAADLAGFTPSPGVVLTITYSGSDGWAGITTHPSVALAQCGLAVNGAAASLAPPAVTAGVIACTSP